MSFRELFATDGLSLERLHALVSVADAGSIAAAAPDDKNRQSLLSRQLGELEKFFDVTLKRVEGRTARLTEDGRQLAGLAREHLQSLDEFKREVSDRPLNVSLATGASLHAWLVLPRLASLRAETGRVVWQLHTRRNAAMYQQLVDGSLDFALLRSDLAHKQVRLREPREPGGFDRRQVLGSASLGTLSYSVFIPDQVCPRTAGLSLEAILADLPIATQGDDTLFQLRLESALAKQKWRLNAAFYAESFPQVAQAVAGGTVAGVLPDLAAMAFDPARVWRAPLGVLPGLSREICLAWNASRFDRLSWLAKLRPTVERVLRFWG